jgi:hypothetical protein
LNSIIEETGQLRPDWALPEIGVNGDGYQECHESTTEADGDNGLQGNTRLPKKVEEQSCEKKSQLRAKDDTRKDG